MQHRQRTGILPPPHHLISTDLLRAQVCNTKYDTVQEQECTTVQEQECTTVNEQQCSTVNEQVKPYLFYLSQTFLNFFVPGLQHCPRAGVQYRQ